MNTKLKFVDRYLTLWIFLAMFLGIVLGFFIPEVAVLVNKFSYKTTNLPLAAGLICMMYPPLVKVDFSKINLVLNKPKLLIVSMFITWVVGPFLMFLLAITFLKNSPDYLTGLIIIGIAPCIAMVIVWNELAAGNRELVAGLVGLNSLLQVAFFSVYAYFYLEIMLPLFGFKEIVMHISMKDIAQTVGLYLGVPFFLALLSRFIIIKTKGIDWLNRKYIPAISPITLWSLLFTILVMFSLKGETILTMPADVLKIALPLVVFFLMMFFLMFTVSKLIGSNYADTAAVSFTAAGNNFELAIAVSIGVFGVNSGQALAGVVGPLVEVPALILLVKASLYFKNKWR